MKTAARGNGGKTVRNIKAGRARRMAQGVWMLAVAASLAAVGSAWGAGSANIQVNNVAAGSAAVARAGSVTTIRTGGQNTIINYQRLGVGVGETLRFEQPNAASRVLNRIQGSDPTKIDGTLWSNGRVYLVNPAGVMFGNGAVVNVGGLYAAAGHISDQNFLGGVNAFTGNTGVVRNDGVITGNQVHLVGLNVENFGQIVTGDSGGVVTMTAGKDVYIGETTSPTGAPLVLVKVSSDGGTHAGTGVNNGGKVDAGSGSLQMGAGDVYAAGIYNSGGLKGRAISLNSGANTNVNTGTIDARNANGKGGAIEIVGDKVGVFGGTVDASGATGGGTIKIGGDFHGAAGTLASSQTVIGSAATVKADALTSGDGGKIAIWSDDVTLFGGTVDARGGAGGNGGYVEVSGKNNLIFRGTVDVSAAIGATGTLLMDPRDLTIAHGISGSGADDAEVADNFIDFTDGFPPTSNNFTISDGSINALSANVELRATRNLIVNGTVVINMTTAGKSLVMRAGSDITINVGARITTNGGGILVSAGDQNETAGDDGNISFGAGGTITSGGGDIIMRATDMTIGGIFAAGVGTVAFETNQAGHVIHLGTGSTGDLNLSQAELGTTIASAGKLRIGDNAFQTGNVTISTLDLHSSNTQLEINAGTGNVVLTDGAGPALAWGQNIAINAANITAANATNTHAEIATNTGTLITLNAGAAIGSGTHRIQVGTFDGTTEAGFTGQVDLTAVGNVFVGGLGGFNATLESAAALDISAFGDIHVTVVGATAPAMALGTAAAQALTVDGTGAIQVHSILTSAGDTLVIHAGTAGTGNLSFAAATTISADHLTLQAGKGDGSVNTAAVDFTTAPTIVNAIGTGTPADFVIRQDAAIADAGLAAAQFTHGLPTNYTLQSDGADVALTTAANVAGTNLTLSGKNGVAINTALTAGNAVTSLTTVGTTTLSGNVAVGAGNVTIGGNLIIKQDTTLSGTGLDITGTVGSESGKVWTLTTTFTGATVFEQGIDTTAGSELGALTVSASGGTLAFGNASATAINTKEDTVTNATADGHISIGENLTLLGNTTITVTTTTAAGSLGAGVADVTFGGTIDSQASQHFALAVNTAGVTWFQGNVGSAVNGQLGGVTTDAGGGAFEVTKLGNGGTFGITVGSPITFGDDVVLMANTTLMTSGISGHVLFHLTLNSEANKVWMLAVNAGGVTGFDGNVGGAANGQLGKLTVDSAGGISLGNGGAVSILTKEDTVTNAGANGGILLNNAVTLLADATLTATATTFVPGVDDITLAQLSGGDAFGITVNTQGVTSFAGGVNSGAGVGLTTITTDAGGTTTFGVGSGAIAVNTTGVQLYGDKVVLQADTAFKGASLTFNGSPIAIDANTQDLTLQSDSMTFLGGANSVQGGGNLKIKAFADSDNIVVGDTGALPNTLYLSPTALATFKDGFTTITIGSATMTGAMTITGDPVTGDPVVFTDPVTFLATGVGASITLNDILPVNKPAVYGDGNGSITVHGTSITLNASIATNGNDITVNGATVLGSPQVVLFNAVDPISNSLGSSGSAAGGNVTLIGTVDDTGPATFMQLFTLGTVSSGNVDLQAAIGGTTPVESLLVNANDLKLHSDIRTMDGGIIGGEVSLGVNTVTVVGDLHSTITIDTDKTGGASNAGIFSTSAPIDHDTISSAVALVIDTSADGGGAGADITLTNVGVTHALGGLTLIAGTGNVTLTNVNLTGAFSSSGAAFNLNAAGGIDSTTGGVTINHTGLVTLDSHVAAGTGDVNITGAGITTAAAGTVTGAGVTLTGGSGAVNLSGIVTATGALSISGTGVTTNAGATLGGVAITLGSGSSDVLINDTVTATGVFTSTGRIFTNNAVINAQGVSITHNGAVNIDNDLSSAGFDVSVTGVGITNTVGSPISGSGITLDAGSGAVTLNDLIIGTGAVGITGVGITANVGATIGGVAITLASGAGNVLLQDTVTGTGLFTSTGTIFTNNGVINAHGMSVTHTGALNINNAWNSAGFAVSGTGVGIIQAAVAPISGSAITLNSGSGAVSLNAAVTGTGAVGITGVGITANVGATIGGVAITLASGAGNVLLQDTVTGTGLFTSTGTIFTNNGVINANGISITHTGAVNINNDLSSAGFAVSVTGVGIIDASGAPITGTTIALAGGSGGVTLNSPVTATLGLTITGTGITTNVGATLGGVAITLTSGSGNVAINDTVTGTGLFTSTGAIFTNNGVINAQGILITHTGVVNINKNLNSAGFGVNVTGVGIIDAAGAAISGTTIALAGGTGAVTLNSPVTATAGLSISGTGITANVGATLGGVAITLTGGTGNVVVNDTVTGTGLFTSTGVIFTNNGVINAHGITITHTGAVNIDNDLSSAGFAVSVTGVGITSLAGAPISGTTIALAGGSGPVILNDAVTATATLGITGTGITANVGATLSGTAITLTGGSGNVSVGDTVTATGLFTSTGAVFTNGGVIGAHGILITHTGAVNINNDLSSAGFAVSVTGVGITSLSGAPITGTNITLAGGSGPVILNDAVTATGALSITGAGITTNAGATLGGVAITLTGGSGNVTLSDVVTGTGLFTSTGTIFTNNAAIGAHGVTINHTGAVNILGPLNSAGFAVNITGNTIVDGVGATIAGSAITLTDTAGVSIAAVITGGFTSTGAGAFTITSTGGITDGVAPVTITHASGLVTIGGAISAPGEGVNITGLGILSTAGGTISGVGEHLIAGAGNITLGATVTGTSGFLTASGVNFSNSAAVTMTGGVTLNMTGTVVISAALGGGAGAVAITSTTFSNTGAVSGNSMALNQSGLVTLGAALTTSGGGVRQIQIDSAGINQTAGIITAGNLSVRGTGNFLMPNGNIAGSFSADVTGNLTFTTAGAMNIGHGGTPDVGGIVTHGGALVLTAGTSLAFDTINTGTGNITLTGNSISSIGTGLTGGAITATAADNNALSLPIVASGAFTMTGLNVTADQGVTAASISITATNSMGVRALTATSGNITLSAGSPILMAGNYIAAGDVTAGALLLQEATTITAGGAGGITVGNVTGPVDLTLTANNANSTIAMGAIGTLTVSRLGNLTVKAANFVNLHGDIFAKNVVFGDNLAGTRADVPTTATISSNGSRVVDADGTFVMEQNQKFTVHDSVLGIGDLTIKTNNHEMTLGDLSALGKITLDAGDVNTHITFVNRAPQRELQPGGALDTDVDKGTDIVAGFNGVGAISIKGTVVVVGGDALHRIQFASAAASNDITGKPGILGFLAGSNLFVVPVNISSGDAIHESNMVSSGTVLDLVAKGTSGTSPSATQGTVIPRDVQTLTPERGQAISGALRDALRELGIYARDLRTDEIIEYLIGRALYDDVPYKLDPGPTDNQVAANRLPYSPVLPTVDAYRKLFFKQDVDENGKPVTENGKPKMTSQDSVILRSFGEAWLAYTKDKGDDATPKAFRGYLESKEKDDPKMATALDYLNQFRDLLAQIKSLGLTTTEFDVSRKVLVSKVRPPNIKEEDFMDVVNGPTSRGTGVAVK